MSFNADQTCFCVALINGKIIIKGEHIFETSNIQYCVKQAIGVQGFLTLSAQSDGTVTILSDNENDQSILNVMIW
jgi:hypothetical protein